MKNKILLLSLLTLLSACSMEKNTGEKVGEASTRFNILGKNDRIEIEVFDDPDFHNISCYLSYAKKGGLGESINAEEDTSEVSIACIKRSNEKIVVAPEKQNPTEIYKRRASMVLKTTQVVRHYDSKRNSFVYLVYSDKVLDGSPKNSVSAVFLD